MLLFTYSVVQGIFTLKCPAFSDVPLNLEPYWGHSSLWVQWVQEWKGLPSWLLGEPPLPRVTPPSEHLRASHSHLFLYVFTSASASPSGACDLGWASNFYKLAWRPFVFFLVSVSSSIMSCPHFPMPSLPKFVQCFSGMHWPLVPLRSLSSVCGWSSGRCSSTDAPTASAQS